MATQQLLMSQLFTRSRLRQTPLKPWADELLPLITHAISAENDGNIPRWNKTLSLFPHIIADKIILDTDAITVISNSVNTQQIQELTIASL